MGNSENEIHLAKQVAKKAKELASTNQAQVLSSMRAEFYEQLSSVLISGKVEATSWHVEEGVPDVGFGNATDLYIDRSTSDLYRKEGGSWEQLSSLRGEKGDPGKDGKDGTDGLRGLRGIAGLDGKDGVDGKDAKPAKNGRDGLDGKDGTDGKDGLNGSRWYTDRGEPKYNLGEIHDFYLDSDSGEYYEKTSRINWESKGSLKGPPGRAVVVGGGGGSSSTLPHNHEDVAGGGQLDHGLSLTGASLLDDDHTQYVLLAGRAGGQDIKGGTASTDHLLLRANDEVFNNLDTGRIELKSQVAWDDAAAINGAFDGFLFTVGNFALIKNTGTFTLSPAMNAGTITTVASQATLRYSSSQIITTAPVFLSANTIQPTAATSDNAASLWASFLAADTYKPHLLTAITATTPGFRGYIANPQVGIEVGSHASAQAVVGDLIGFQAFSSLITNVTNQGTATLVRGFVANNPTKSGTGIIGTAIGLDVEAINAGSTANIGVRVGLAGTYAQQFTDTTGVAAGGITFAADTNLYRGAPDYLYTDDNIKIGLNQTFVKEVAHTIKIDNTTTASTPGAALSILGADGSSSVGGTGGAITITAGGGVAGNGAGGALNLTGGVGVGISGGGGVNIAGGAALTGGNVNINAGGGVATGNVRLASTAGMVQVGHTTAPTAMLDVRARVAATTTFSADNLSNTGAIADFKDNGTSVWTIADGGNLNAAAASHIVFGGDTNLYRFGVDTLKTDDNLIALAASSTVAGSVLTLGGAGVQAQILRRLSVGV